MWDDVPLITAAKQYGTIPILVLTPFGADGQFNNRLINSVVNNPTYAQNLIQNLHGPPMAVAPINQVRRVVEYAVTEIAREKIDLGIPNYGYDWPLPYERGVTQAAAINNVQAVQIAVREGAEIQFDENAMSPFFRYTDELTGIAHEVWFEDVRSLQAKFDLIKEFGLRGCGYWQIMQWFRANWLLLSENFWVNK